MDDVHFAQERVVWDVQDTGVKELEMIRKETERLESLLTARSLRGPPGSSFSERAILSPVHAVERRSICEGSSQEAVIRAHLQMSKKLRAENSHLSAKDSMPAACSKFAQAVMRSSSSTSQLSLPGSTAKHSGIK
jgi:hypothetical protein